MVNELKMNYMPGGAKVMDFNEKLYTSSEVAVIFNIGESSLRRWCLELKRNGYTFAKDSNKSRLFDVHDIIAIFEFKNNIKLKGKSLVESGIEVSSSFRRDKVTNKMIPNNSKEGNDNYNQIEFIIEHLNERQSEFEKRITEKIDSLVELMSQEKIVEVKIKNSK